MTKFKNPYAEVMSNPLGTPQFPGGDILGMNIEQIRSLIKVQKRARGYSLPVQVGANQFPIEISGTAKIFLGFMFGTSFGVTPISRTFSLTINNEILIQSGITGQFSVNGIQHSSNEFFYFPRPLNGHDQILLQLESLGAGTEYFNVWYI